MKNKDLGKKIKELRAREGFSQEALAEETSLSLRTIQRIENGESIPRGDTFKKIAAALKVTPDELMDWSEQEDNGYLVTMVLSSLTFLIFPLLGVIVPLILWILKRNKIKNVESEGKKVLNFQITWSIFLFVFYIFLFLVFFRIIELPDIKLPFDIPFFGLISIAILLNGANIVFVILNAIRLHQEKKTWYPSLRFIR